MKTRNRVARGGLAIGTVAAATVLATAGIASATVYTVTNPTGGAQSLLENNGRYNMLTSCDHRTDHHSSVLQLSRNTSAGTISFIIRNAGGNGSCKTDYIENAQDKTQHMRACLADGGGAVFSCSGWKAVGLT